MEKPFKRYIKCLNIFKRDIQLSIENSKSLKWFKLMIYYRYLVEEIFYFNNKEDHYI